MTDPLGHRLVDVGEAEIFSFDWTPELEEDVLLAESTWAIEPDDSPIPILSDSARDENITSVKIDGVHFGVVYTLTNTVLTEDGRSLVQSFTLRGTRK